MPLPARIAAVALALIGLAASTSASLARTARQPAPAPAAAAERADGTRPRSTSTSRLVPATDFNVGLRRAVRAESRAAAIQATETLVAPKLIARVTARRGVVVHRRPTRSSRGRRLTRVTDFGSRRALAVHEVRGAWLGVASSVRTDGGLGWVHRRAPGLRVRPARVEIEVDLSRRHVNLTARGRLVSRVRVAVGARRTSTPTGRFTVTDKLRGTRFGPYYGCCVLALSGTQPNLPAGWSGGDRLAIHGTDSPGRIGTASSAGCLRGADRPLRVLMRRVPLGTPVHIHK